MIIGKGVKEVVNKSTISDNIVSKEDSGNTTIISIASKE